MLLTNPENDLETVADVDAVSSPEEEGSVYGAYIKLHLLFDGMVIFIMTTPHV